MGLALSLIHIWGMVRLSTALTRATSSREMRARHINTPVIILTARGEEYDKLAGLEGGADDLSLIHISCGVRNGMS